MSMMKEFKEFAVKGNVVDMAVGIVIGGAFGKMMSLCLPSVSCWAASISQSWLIP